MYFMLTSIEMAERDVTDADVLGMACQDFGRVYLDQYLDPNHFTMEGEDAELLLNSVVEHTQKGLTTF